MSENNNVSATAKIGQCNSKSGEEEKAMPIDYQKIIKSCLGSYCQPGKRYHSELPEDLQNWYCYTTDGGHSILANLDTHLGNGYSHEDNAIPIPVKAVLKGYHMLDGWVIVHSKESGLEYDSSLGLHSDEEDDEFDSDTNPDGMNFLVLSTAKQKQGSKNNQPIRYPGF